MGEKKNITVFVTKYALTEGIKEIQARVCSSSEDMIQDLKFENTCCGYYHKKGRDWHKTKESAVKRAEEMRKKKIASLKKQIEKLEKMQF